MKELISAQEKANAYDKAIEVIRKCETDKYGCVIGIKPSDIFSELKESGDERIRKALIDGFTVMKESKNCGKTFSNHNIPVADILAWLEKQGEKMKAKSEVIKDYTGEENVWNNACDFRPKHMQRCLCYDKYMGGVYCYVYDDISKYWCTQTTEEHDPDGDNHICDYADYRVTVWMCLPKTTFYPKKQGEQNPYSGASFKYNGHTWGMCARDNGVEILIDGHLKGRVFTNDSNAKERFIKALERVEEQNNKGYKLTDCDKISWWEDFKAYTSCTIVQKPADNVKPKFKVGDWVVNNHGEPQLSQVISYSWPNSKIKRATNNLEIFINKATLDKQYHLWTIEDAKDGDILSWDDSKCIALFKNIYDDVSFNSYGFVGHCTGTFESRPTFHDIEGAHPATKEQRDTLMKAMADAGYTFDFKKKELKEIHATDEGKAEMGNCFTKMMNGEKVSPIWCEEDENEMNHILSVLEDKRKEQEKKGYNNLSGTDKWLKSIKDRYAWKPSKEQIEALEHFVRSIGESGYALPYDNNTKLLYSLLEQLKKLKE